MVEGSAPHLDAVYAALSHAVRRDILDRLTLGSARVTDLAEPYAISLAAVSKHLRQLEDAELVSRRIVGRDHVLAVRPSGLDGAHEWIAAHRAFWESRLDALDAVVRKWPRR